MNGESPRGEVGTVAPAPERVRSDQAQLLVTTALAVGTEPAADAATRALDRDEPAAMLPYVQLPRLTARQRSKVRASKFNLDGLRKRVAEQAELPALELQRMSRVTLSSLLQTVLFIAAYVALAAGTGGLDFGCSASNSVMPPGGSLSRAHCWFRSRGLRTLFR